MRSIQGLYEPAKVCNLFSTLEEIGDVLTSSRPVFIKLKGRWKMLLPDKAFCYGPKRRVLDLPLTEAPLIPLETSVIDAANKLQSAGLPYGLVIEKEEPVGLISFDVLLKEIIEETREKAEEERFLSDIYKVLSKRKPGQILEDAIRLLAQRFSIESAIIVHMDASPQPIVAQWIRSGWEEATRSLIKLYAEMISKEGSFRNLLKRKAPSALGHVERGECIYRPDLKKRETFLAKLSAEKGFRSSLLLPLKYENQWGFVLFFLSAKAEAFSESDLETIKRMGPVFSQVVRAWSYEKELERANLSLEERVRQRTCELEQLCRLVTRFSNTLSYGELFKALVESIRHIKNLDIVAWILAVGDLPEIRICPTRPLSDGLTEQVKKRLLDSLKVVKKKSVVVDLKQEGEQHPELPLVKNLHSFFQVPLNVTGEKDPLGFLMVASEVEKAFEKPEINFITTVAVQTAASIQRLRMLLASEHKMLKTLIENLPEGVILLDSQMRLTLANSAAETYLPLLTAAGIGDRIEHLGGIPIAKLLDSPPEGKSVHELTVSEPDYKVFEVSSKEMKAGLEEGGWVLTLRDVTAERESRERMEQQGRLAAVGQLAAGIAHDLSNLLTPIIGYASVFKNSLNLDRELRECLNIIYQQGVRASQLIRQILDFSRKSVSRKEVVDLVPFLKENLKVLERTLPENIRLSLEVSEPGEHIVKADLVQLQQVITNLAINARDAMPEGGKISIRLYCKSFVSERTGLRVIPPGDWVILEFSDTGVGMSRDVMARIFEPFFTTKTRREGTGLGLSQVYGLIRQHDGYIDVRSEVGKGTTFIIYLPAYKKAKAVEGKDRNESLPSGRGEAVLIVEDDAPVRYMLEKVLRKLGYRALSASDGREGLDIFSKRKDEIRVVLTDMVMPRMGGVTFIKALRSLDPGAKIIAMSGYPLGKESLPEDITCWLSKPVEIRKLAEELRKCLDLD